MGGWSPPSLAQPQARRCSGHQHRFLVFYWVWGSPGPAALGGLLHLHEGVQEALQVIVQAVGAGQAEAEAAVVQRGHAFPLHTLHGCPAQPWLQLRGGLSQARPGSMQQ